MIRIGLAGCPLTPALSPKGGEGAHRYNSPEHPLSDKLSVYIPIYAHKTCTNAPHRNPHPTPYTAAVGGHGGMHRARAGCHPRIRSPQSSFLRRNRPHGPADQDERKAGLCLGCPARRPTPDHPHRTRRWPRRHPRLRFTPVPAAAARPRKRLCDQGPGGYPRADFTGSNTRHTQAQAGRPARQHQPSPPWPLLPASCRRARRDQGAHRRRAKSRRRGPFHRAIAEKCRQIGFICLQAVDAAGRFCMFG